MPLSLALAPRIHPSAAAPRRLALRLALAAAALVLVAGAAAGLAGLFGAGLAPPPRSPFGVGFREAAPAASGFGGFVLALQAQYARALQGALAAVAREGVWPLLTLGFVYGVVHAAGPGHGKAVIAGYLVASDRAVRRGLALSVAAALVQALVAIALVAVGRYLVGATASGLDRVGTAVEAAGFAAVAAVGAWVTWRKAGALAARLGGEAEATCGPGCGHAVTPASAGSLREAAGVVLAAGLRPCAGAVLLLVLAATRGLFPAGIAGVLAMALGTALTTAVLAALAVGAKGLALRLAAGRGGTPAIAAVELLAGAFVLVVGLALLLALVAGGPVGGA